MKNKEKKQVEASEVLKPNVQKLTIKVVIPGNTLTEEAKNELNKIKEIEKNADREKASYRTNEYTCSFKNVWTINTFDRDIYNVTIAQKKLINIKVIY